jgi:hypothetical protein
MAPAKVGQDNVHFGLRTPADSPLQMVDKLHRSPGVSNTARKLNDGI